MAFASTCDSGWYHFLPFSLFFFLFSKWLSVNLNVLERFWHWVNFFTWWYVPTAELGDFDPHQHTVGYVSEFCFVPNQTEELERRIAAIHRRLGWECTQVQQSLPACLVSSSCKLFADSHIQPYHHHQMHLWKHTVNIPKVTAKASSLVCVKRELSSGLKRKLSPGFFRVGHQLFTAGLSKAAAVLPSFIRSCHNYYCDYSCYYYAFSVGFHSTGH